MFSLPQVYGLVPVEGQAKYEPLKLSNQALKAAFEKAKELRTQIYSDEYFYNTIESDSLRQFAVGELSGIEEIFLILGISDEYFSYLHK